MGAWKQYRRLLWPTATLSRVLSEMEMERLTGRWRGSVEGPACVAGGGRKSRGSEAVFLRVLREGGGVVFADISPGRKPHVIADLARPWPFGDGQFGCVASTWVLEHVSRPQTFVNESFRVLRPGGIFLCAVPFLFQRHGSPHDFHRFTETAISQMTREAGFSETDVQAVGGTPFLCCVSLIWPILRIPLLGILLFGLARMMDGLLCGASRLTGRGAIFLSAFPINYIFVARK